MNLNCIVDHFLNKYRFLKIVNIRTAHSLHKKTHSSSNSFLVAITYLLVLNTVFAYNGFETAFGIIDTTMLVV